MNDQLPKFEQLTLLDIPSATSLPESVGGPTPCALPDGQIIGQSGQDHAHASRSAKRGSRKELQTPATCGLTGSGLSESAALSQYLANRLQPRFDTAGSTLFRQTWKVITTPSGRQLWAHTASVPRTSGSGSTSWPTPRAEDAESSGMRWSRGKADTLTAVSSLAAWPSPTSNSGTGAGTQGRAGGLNLQTAAALASPWATPSSRDWKDTPGMATTGTNPDGSTRTRLDQLPRQAQLAGSGGGRMDHVHRRKSAAS